MINLDLEQQINAQIESAIRTYLDSDELRSKIREQVDSAVGIVIERVASKVYADVVRESNISEHITNIVQLEANQHIQEQSLNIVREELARTPVKDIVVAQVQREADIRFSKMDMPEGSISPSAIAWKKGCLNGSYISGGLIDKFSSAGIDDKSNNVQLTILDDHVVVEGEFTAMNVTAADTVNAKNISLTGTLEIGTDIIDHGALASLMQTHFEIKIEQALEPFMPLLNEGQAIAHANALSPSIVSSNIRKLGNLQDLSVMGDAKFSETFFIGSNGKVGLNTDEPRGALTIRDDDAEITFSRTGRRTMFVGSTRDNHIELGVNEKAQITLSEDMINITSPIRVSGIKFSAIANVPDREGEPNEIVFVTSARPEQPKFYICLGGNRWQALNK